MPTLPLSLPFSLAAPDPAVQSADDVLAQYPRDYKTAAHQVLGAINAAHVGVHANYTAASDYAAQQSDILRASGPYLDGLLGDHGCFRAPGEFDEAYRARGLSWPGVVTPDAIMAAVNAILAPYTAVLAQYCESILDRWFVEDGSATWGSFVGDSATVTVGPQYLDRLYPVDVALNDGVFRPQSDPGEAMIFTDDAGRCFFLRIPELNDANGPTSYACDGTGDPVPVSIIVDGDMEAVGTAAWTAVNAATLSKETAYSLTGGKWLRAFYNGTPLPGAAQAVLEIDEWYLIVGRARSDGFVQPAVVCGGTNVWTGTTEFAWQPFCEVFQAANVNLILSSYASAGGQYSGFDDVMVYHLRLPVFPQPQSGMFVEDGTATDTGMAYVSNDYLLADETYQAVINSVNRIRGAGVRWILNVDPRLQ